MSKSRLSLWAIVAGLATALLLGSISLLWDRARQREFHSELKSQVTLTASEIRARLEAAINSRLFVATGLIDYVGSHPDLTQADYERVAPLFVNGRLGIRGVQLARGGTISHVFPYPPNRSALGFHVTDDPLQGPAARRAVEKKETVVGGPVQLVQGGRAVVSRTPIYVTRDESDFRTGDYWGLIIVVIPVQTLLDESRIQPTVTPPGGTQIQLALRGKDARGASGAAFYGSPEVFDRQPLLMDVALPNGSWQLGAVPAQGWNPLHPWTVPRRMITLLVTVMTSLLAYFLVRSVQQLRAEVAARARTESELRARTSELSEALGQVQTLRGLLPICAHCKKIRDDQGYWSHIERYVEEHSNAVFSHGLCPDCAQELYGDEPWFQGMQAAKTGKRRPAKGR